MSHPQWTSSFLTGTVTATPAVNASYPAQRIITLDQHPIIRAARSTSTAQQDYEIDFGAVKSVVAVAVLGTNFRLVNLAHAASVGGSYTDLGTFSVPQNRWTKRYNLFLLKEFNNRVLRVRIPSQTMTDGAAYSSLGFVWATDALQTLARSPRENREITVNRAYLESGDEVTPAGPLHLLEEWQLRILDTGVADMQTIAALGRDTPVLFFDNNDDPAAVRIWRFQDSLSFREQARAGVPVGRTRFYDVNPRWKEQV